MPKVEGRLFEIYPSGDPYSTRWDVTELQDAFGEQTCIYRGDISGLYSQSALIRYLRRNHPGCTIRISK